MNMDVRSIRTTLVLCALLAGCQSRQFYFFKDEELAQCRHAALEIEQPCEPACHTPPPCCAPPISPEAFEKMPLWDLPLQEAIAVAVSNSKIARRLPVGPPNFLLENPQGLATALDPAIQAAGVPGSAVGIGAEAALAQFDAQLTANMLWERNERPINTGGIGDVIFARNFEQDRAVFQGELSKTNVTGGRMFARHNVIYDLNNNPTRGVPSSYDINYEIGVTQPLLAGAGVKFNRIAGPLRGDIATQLVLQEGGVLIGRINEDVALADFEKAVRDMVFDVETAYWELYVAYRTFDSVRAGRDAALMNWRRVKDFQRAKVIGGEALLLAQARSQYYRFVGDLEQALCNVLQAENRLRYVMGICPNDGRLIRPSDDPQRAKVVFDWNEIHLESLTRSVELRRQKWIIQRRELALIAARNLLLPRLDAVALYRWLGAGDTLIDPNGRGVPPFEGSNAYSTLTSGDYQEWNLGFQFSMPLGFRMQMVTVRNAQLQVARERARLEEQELELAHALTEAVRNLDCFYIIAQRRLDELYATHEEVRQVATIWDSGVRKIGLLEVRNTDYADAIAKRALAETAYYQALADYNRAIAEVHLRKGSLLEYNRVFLAEGPWPRQAYCDARDKAFRRVSAWPLNYVMRTEPGVVSHGPYGQWQENGHAGVVTEEVAPHTPGQPTPSDLPTPDKSPRDKLPTPQEKPGSSKPTAATETSSPELSAPTLGPPIDGPPQARAATPRGRSWGE
jgi:outer membrane protein TolC